MRFPVSLPAVAPLRAALAGVLAAALIVGLLGVRPAEAAEGHGDEQLLLELVNAERGANGLAAFRVCADLADVARDWSSGLADDGRLSHNPELGDEVRGWWSLAENVAYDSSVEGVHQTLMNSTGHRAHILSDTFTEVGFGLEHRGELVWVTQVFREPDGSATCDSAGHAPPATAPPNSPADALIHPGGTTACPTDLVPGAPFEDTRGNEHRRAIDCVVWYGLANGTSATRYSPSADVTRGQMASLLARLVDRSHAPLPHDRDHDFGDVAGNPHETAISRLAAAGIAQGTAPDRFEPNARVTRAQAATFVVATDAFITGDTLPATRDWFSDDDGLVHEDAINRAAEAGLVSGVSASRYLPNRPLQRDQLSSLLARALNRLVERGVLTRAY